MENLNGTRYQKNIQKVLEKRNLWHIKELKLAYSNFKSLDYQTPIKFKLCIKKI